MEQSMDHARQSWTAGYVPPPRDIISYTAGFFDGEGSIGTAGNRYNVSVAQSDINNGETILRALKKEWGDIGCIFRSNRKFRERDNICTTWTIGGTFQVKFFLTACLPYFRVKRDRAVYILRDLERHMQQSRKNWSPAEDKILREMWNAEHDQWDIAEAIGRSEPALRHRAKALGLPRKPRIRR
jgi:hypothetical protein